MGKGFSIQLLIFSGKSSCNAGEYFYTLEECSKAFEVDLRVVFAARDIGDSKTVLFIYFELYSHDRHASTVVCMFNFACFNYLFVFKLCM